MLLQSKSPTEALNKAYLRETVNRGDIERIQEQLTLLFERAEHLFFISCTALRRPKLI